jgi:FkbM family methyltransferase
MSKTEVKWPSFPEHHEEAETALRDHPTVEQAVVLTQEQGTGVTGSVVGYVVASRPKPRTFDLAALEEVNPYETSLLYEDIVTNRSYLRGGVTLRSDAVVFDVGANIGMFSLFVHENCPSSTLYAFEPVTPVCTRLEQNLAPFGSRAHVFGHGLSDTESEVTFAFYPGYSVISGLSDYADPQAEADVVRTLLVNDRAQGAESRGGDLLEHFDEVVENHFQPTEEPCLLRRLSQVIDEQEVDRIDLLKIDVQRAELDVLRGLEERHWPLVRQVAMEIHDQDGTATEGRLQQIVTLLRQHGFAVWSEQESLLAGTDRHNLAAVRPDYASDPRPVVADSAHGPGLISEPELLDWLATRLPREAVPQAVVLVDEIPAGVVDS